MTTDGWRKSATRAGNPHPGLPPSGDLRWLNLGRKLSPGRPHICRENFCAKCLPEAAARILRRTANELAGKQERWRELNADSEDEGAG